MASAGVDGHARGQLAAGTAGSGSHRHTAVHGTADDGSVQHRARKVERAAVEIAPKPPHLLVGETALEDLLVKHDGCSATGEAGTIRRIHRRFKEGLGSKPVDKGHLLSCGF